VIVRQRRQRLHLWTKALEVNWLAYPLLGVYKRKVSLSVPSFLLQLFSRPVEYPLAVVFANSLFSAILQSPHFYDTSSLGVHTPSCCMGTSWQPQLSDSSLYFRLQLRLQRQTPNSKHRRRTLGSVRSQPFWEQLTISQTPVTVSNASNSFLRNLYTHNLEHSEYLKPRSWEVVHITRQVEVRPM